jgi:outer membrane biosynthesis protein TonB
MKTAAPRKYGWLPLLTVLFLISYGLMTMLIVEQGATIESQRALIRELFHDSTELSAVRMKAQQERAQAQTAQTQSPVTQSPMTQHPSTQAPSTQAPKSQAPSSQAAPQHRPQSQAGKQKPFQMPSKPASDLTDASRNLITI